MYSSVPTNEFDCVLGSAKKVGGGWSFGFLLFDGVACCITCKTGKKEKGKKECVLLKENLWRKWLTKWNQNAEYFANTSLSIKHWRNA